MEVERNNREVELFLDSGAYSAFTQGVEIDIYEYIDFIKRNINIISVYANLDVIGDAEATWANQMIMEDAGLRPLPVFHYKEPFSFLEKYLKRGYDYVALGGLVTKDRANMRDWFDLVFEKYLCDKKGWPIVKVHGFGMTSLKYMIRYPWYSVDSTSWVLTGRMGDILIPKRTGGKYDYSKNPFKLTVSNSSPAQGKIGGHFNSHTKKQQEIFRQYFEEKGFIMGSSLFMEKDPEKYQLKDDERWNKKKDSMVEKVLTPGLSNDYRFRDQLNIIYFLELEKNLPKWPWQFKIKRKMMRFF